MNTERLSTLQFIDIIYSCQNNGNLIIYDNKDNKIFEEKIYADTSRFMSISISKNIIWETCRLLAPQGFNIIEEKKRDTYFNFYNLKNQYSIQDIIEDKNYKKNINNIHSGITFFVTYKCTYKCPFCWQRSGTVDYTQEKGIHFDVNVVSSVFNKLKPSFIYFTGGEPTLYKNLFLMISKLDPNIKCRITSNLGPSFDVDKFVNLITPDRFEMLMFSYHPSETTLKEFLSKIDKLIENKFTNILVESVLYENDIQHLVEIRPYLLSRNITCRYDKCVLPNKTYKLQHDQEQLAEELLKQGQDNQNEKDIPLRQTGNPFAEKDALILCPAGHKNFHIDPLGDIYTCMSALDRSKIFGKSALPHYCPIGNIQDENFNYLKEPILCWEPFRCSACDYDSLQSGWYFLSNDHPPLPE